MSLFETLGKKLQAYLPMAQKPNGKYSPLQSNENGELKVDTEISVNGDVNVDQVGVENVAGTKVNPATEDTLSNTKNSIDSVISGDPLTPESGKNFTQVKTVIVDKTDDSTRIPAGDSYGNTQVAVVQKGTDTEVDFATETTLDDIKTIQTFHTNILNMLAQIPNIFVSGVTELPIQDGPSNGYSGYDEFTTSKISFYTTDKMATVDAPVIISDDRDFANASRLWLSRNHDTTGGDDWRAQIDNNNLIKGVVVTDYTTLSGSLYMTELKQSVSDSKVQELLSKRILLNDQSYDNCQRISSSNGLYIDEVDSNMIVFHLPKSALDFNVKSKTTYYGYLSYSTCTLVQEHSFPGAYFWEVDIAENTGDDTELKFQISADNLVTNADNLVTNYGVVYSSISVSDVSLFVGRPAGEVIEQKINTAMYRQYDILYKQLRKRNTVDLLKYYNKCDVDYLGLDCEAGARAKDGSIYGGTHTDPETDAEIYEFGGTVSGSILTFKVDVTSIPSGGLDTTKTYFVFVQLFGSNIQDSFANFYFGKLRYINSNWLVYITPNGNINKTGPFPDLLDQTNGSKTGYYANLVYYPPRFWIIDKQLYTNGYRAGTIGTASDTDILSSISYNHIPNYIEVENTGTGDVNLDIQLLDGTYINDSVAVGETKIFDDFNYSSFVVVDGTTGDQIRYKIMSK